VHNSSRLKQLVLKNMRKDLQFGFQTAANELHVDGVAPQPKALPEESGRKLS